MTGKYATSGSAGSIPAKMEKFQEDSITSTMPSTTRQWWSWLLGKNLHVYGTFSQPHLHPPTGEYWSETPAPASPHQARGPSPSRSGHQYMAPRLPRRMARPRQYYLGIGQRRSWTASKYVERQHPFRGRSKQQTQAVTEGNQKVHY